MHWTFVFLFVFAHLAVYALFLRRLPLFQREGIIFVYHAAAFLAAVGTAVLGWWYGAIGTAAVASILCLQLIYSMTFLEVWSLAQGSYSLQVLVQVARHGTVPVDAIVAATGSIGTDKKASRLRSLVAMGFVTVTRSGEAHLTSSGRLLTSCARAIKVLANIRTAG